MKDNLIMNNVPIRTFVSMYEHLEEAQETTLPNGDRAFLSGTLVTKTANIIFQSVTYDV